MRGVSWSAVTLGVGYAMTAGLVWALLNVPESNLLALALSGTLVILIVAAAGVTTSLAVLVGSSHPTPGSKPSVLTGAFRALPQFVVGLVIFAILWWLTGAIDGWWQAHRGEVDALILYRIGATRTAWLHQGVFLATSFIRWVIGLSVISSLVVAAAFFLGPIYCLRVTLRPVTLLTTAAGVVAVSKGIWTFVYWRPDVHLSNAAEFAFVGVKLVASYAATMAIAAIVLAALTRRVLKTLPPSQLTSFQRLPDSI